MCLGPRAMYTLVRSNTFIHIFLFLFCFALYELAEVTRKKIKKRFFNYNFYSLDT